MHTNWRTCLSEDDWGWQEGGGGGAAGVLRWLGDCRAGEAQQRYYIFGQKLTMAPHQPNDKRDKERPIHELKITANYSHWGEKKKKKNLVTSKHSER